MKRLLISFSLLIFGNTFAQDTVAVTKIADAIAEIEKGNFVSLGLFNDTETTFPSEFFSIPKAKLVGLIIENCHYKSFPSSISEFENIFYFRYSWFYFQDCPLNSFPGFITEATALQHIQIEGVKFLSIPSLSKLKHLEFLSLYYCELPEFPRSVLDVISLTELNLSCNKFTSIPSDIDRLINLKTLNFEGGFCGATPISKVPESIGNLVNLESFSLGFTEIPIETLPNSFYNLKNLKRFECHGCGLTTLSEELSQLQKLESLQLTNLEYFTRLPDALFDLPKMKNFRFYLHARKVDPKLIQQKERIETWGRSFEFFSFEINLF